MDDIDIFSEPERDMMGVPITGSSRDRQLEAFRGMARQRYVDPVENRAKDMIKMQVVEALSNVPGIKGEAISSIIALADSQNPDDKLAFNQIVSRLELPVDLRRMGSDYMASKRFENVLGDNSSVGVSAYLPDEGKKQYSLSAEKRFPNFLGGEARVGGNISTGGDPEIRASFMKRFASGGDVDIFSEESMFRDPVYEDLGYTFDPERNEYFEIIDHPEYGRVKSYIQPSDIADQIFQGRRYGLVTELDDSPYSKPGDLAFQRRMDLMAERAEKRREEKAARRAEQMTPEERKRREKQAEDAFEKSGMVIQLQKSRGYQAGGAVENIDIFDDPNRDPVYEDMGFSFDNERGQYFEVVSHPEYGVMRQYISPRDQSPVPALSDARTQADLLSKFSKNNVRGLSDATMKLALNTAAKEIDLFDEVGAQTFGDLEKRALNLVDKLRSGRVTITPTELEEDYSRLRSKIRDEKGSKGLTKGRGYKEGGGVGAPNDRKVDKSMFRSDGSKKSATGFLGPIKNLVTGGTMTEFTTEWEDAGIEIPTMVPTLSAEEVEYMRRMKPGQGWDRSNPIDASILRKAKDHARMRIKQGISPYYQDGEDQAKQMRVGGIVDNVDIFGYNLGGSVSEMMNPVERELPPMPSMPTMKDVRRAIRMIESPALNALGVPDEDIEWAANIGEKLYPGEGLDGRGDAARHLALGALLSRSDDPEIAKFLGDARESIDFSGGKMDKFNNRLGMQLSGTNEELEEQIVRLIKSGNAEFYDLKDSVRRRGYQDGGIVELLRQRDRFEDPLDRLTQPIRADLGSLQMAIPQEEGLRQRAERVLAGLMGDDREDYRRAEKALMAADVLPVLGDVGAAADLSDAIEKGDLSGAGIAALGLIPVVGGVASRTLKGSRGAFRSPSLEKQRGSLGIVSLDSPIEDQLNLPLGEQKRLKVGYYHPVSGGLKLKTLPKDMDYELSPSGVLVPSKTIKPEDMEGGRVIFDAGDRAVAGQKLVRINGIDLEFPIDLMGGPQFMMYQKHLRDNGGIGSIWASDQGAITSLTRQAVGDEDVYFMPTAMTQTGLDFNTMMSDALIQQADKMKITKKSKKAFDKAVKNIRPEWKGIDSPEARDQLLENGPLRHAFVDRMDQAEFQSMGFPDVAQTRVAITDPSYLDLPFASGGMTVGKVDKGNPILNKKGEVVGFEPVESPNLPHPTYSTQLSGDYVGGFEVPVPRQLLAPDFYKKRREMGVGTGGDARSFQLTKPTQQATPEWVDTISEYIEQVKANQ